MKENNQKEPKTVKAITGNKGIHLYFKYNEKLQDIKSKSHIFGEGYDIDVLSDVEHMATSLTLEEVMNQARHAFGKGAKRSTIILNPKS